MKPITNIESISMPKKTGLLNSFARQRTLSLLSKLDIQAIRIQENGQVFNIGRQGPSHPLIVNVYRPTFWTSIAFGGSVGAAESYMDNDWDCNALLELLSCFAKVPDQLAELDESTVFNYKWLDHLHKYMDRNSLAGSRRNIARHYDLGNRFFEIFLDQHMMYSAGIYQSYDSTLEIASENKLRVVAEKLELSKGDHLLEIGTGWGGLAIYMAKHYGCKVTTTTISSEQYQYAVLKVKEAGLEEQVTVLQEDYRNLSGKFDKIVSIEMIEAVGRRYLPVYFKTLEKLSRPGCKMLLQAITMPEQRAKRTINQVDFIQKYIFPGGSLPSVEAIRHHTCQHTSYQISDLEDITTSYKLTLNAWRNRFTDQLPKIKQMGFSETFIRMWEFYFCYCEAGFRENAIGTVQLLFEKRE